MTNGINPFNWSLDTSAGAGDTPAKIEDTAQQFESLLLGLMLKTARESDGGWFGTGEDSATGAVADLAEQQVAQALAASGGLGLAGMLEEALTKSAQAPGAAPGIK